MLWWTAGLALAGSVSWDLGEQTLQFERDDRMFMAVEDPGPIPGATVVHRSQCGAFSTGPGAWVVTFETRKAARAFHEDPRACSLLPYVPAGDGFVGLRPELMFLVPTDRTPQVVTDFAASQGLVVTQIQGSQAWARWEGVCGWAIADRYTRLDRANKGALTWFPDVTAEVCSDG